jgi:hypothetical protein
MQFVLIITHASIEEISHREQFFKAEGGYLPEDLCPYVGDMPAILEVAVSSDEVSVAIDSEYVAEVRETRVAFCHENDIILGAALYNERSKQTPSRNSITR